MALVKRNRSSGVFLQINCGAPPKTATMAVEKPSPHSPARSLPTAPILVPALGRDLPAAEALLVLGKGVGPPVDQLLGSELAENFRRSGPAKLGGDPISWMGFRNWWLWACARQVGGIGGLGLWLEPWLLQMVNGTFTTKPPMQIGGKLKNEARRRHQKPDKIDAAHISSPNAKITAKLFWKLPTQREQTLNNIETRTNQVCWALTKRRRLNN